MADFLDSTTLPENTPAPDLTKVGRKLDRAEKFLRVCLLATRHPGTPELLDWQALNPVISETLNILFDAKVELGLEEPLEG